MLPDNIASGDIIADQDRDWVQQWTIVTEKYLKKYLGNIHQIQLGTCHDKKEEFQFFLKAQKEFSTDQAFHDLILQFIKQHGLDKSQYLYDRPRLRFNQSGSANILEARPAFSIHRDTWYANPQNQINVWIPLHDVVPENSIVFYPDYFNKPIKNNSSLFDYDTWIKSVGFQKQDGSTNNFYPEALEIPDENGKKSCTLDYGEYLVFSGAHLHQGVANCGKISRLSIDFRIAAIDPNQDRAPNVDNKSTGNAVSVYSRC